MQWFDEHPELLSNPLYIGDDSYAGMIVPTVTSEIAKGNIPRQLSVSVPFFSFQSLLPFFLVYVHILFCPTNNLILRHDAFSFSRFENCWK